MTEKIYILSFDDLRILIFFRKLLKWQQELKEEHLSKTSSFAMGIVTSHDAFASSLSARLQELILIENGRMRMPIITASDAIDETRHAVSELVKYIEKISGVRSDVLHGIKSTPKSAVWIEIQRQLSGVFSDLNLEFQHPEEILIACN